MGLTKSEQPVQEFLDQVLGYLNFSCGNPDANFLANLNSLLAVLSTQEAECERQNACPQKSPGADLVDLLAKKLEQRLERLHCQSEAFRCIKQARQVIDLALRHVLPAYLEHHRDLLFHQSPEKLFNSFFIGRVFEASLAEIHPLMESETGHRFDSLCMKEPLNSAAQQTIQAVINRLNDFIGHRPIASLESQRIEPYEHEWVRPVPVYVRQAGVALGPYQEIIEKAIKILNETNPQILRAAFFDPQRLEELAIDPRAFDFDHPINKRPNHHFGQWDEHQIDQKGYFSRFIIHQVTLDALLERVERDSQPPTEVDEDPRRRPIPREQLMEEAGAVLAGTILMASGVSGNGPGAHHSTVTLGNLLPSIAAYRDQFYDELLQRLPEDQQQRLIQETEVRRQPFGAARQDLNARLAQRRAWQLVNCRLASIFARMGYPVEAEKQSRIVPVAGARIICQIDCLLSSVSQVLDRHRVLPGIHSQIESTNPEKPEFIDQPADDYLLQTIAMIPQVFELLQRGIACGAIVDPWNILGFDANYSLFPAVENSVKDHRVYELVDLMERIFAVCSRLWSEAAAIDRLDACLEIKDQFRTIADWWRKYAAHEVMAVDAVDAEDIFCAAELVAKALNLWHKGGAATGDIEFWSQHAELFDSPKAYALVVDALMQRADYSTSTALLIHWLGQADCIPLQQGDSSFHDLVYRWIAEQRDLLGESDGAEAEAVWVRIRKFHDFIEVNAEHYWEVPRFQLGNSGDARNRETEELLYDPMFDENDDNDDSSPDLFKAAYEDVVYSDTTDDGMEGAIFDSSLRSDDALEAEVDRIFDRLEFMTTIANYWQVAATIHLPKVNGAPPSDEICDRLRHRREILSGWVSQAFRNRGNLIELLESVHQYRLPQSGADHDSLVEYDRNRLFKESLLDRAIATCVATENAVRILLAVVQAVNHLLDETPLDQATDLFGRDTEPDQAILVTVFAAVLLRDPELVVTHFPSLIEHLNQRALLYVPLSKGGDPASIVNARVVQTAMLDLLSTLPALGLLLETHELTVTALAMEHNHPLRQGAVTEFDELFHVAYSSMVHKLIESMAFMKDDLLAENKSSDKKVAVKCENVLFDCIEMLTETMLIPWLDHSRTLRLSVLEKVMDKVSWKRLVEFIERYGDGLFTQQFLHVANIRAILHQGVNQWFDQVLDAPNRPDLRLFDELDHELPRQKAIRYLTLVLEAVIENYNEYRDYNTTTTQSDHGDLVYILLDFLRLESRYDRVCWNLKPVVWAHEILVRDAQNGVARMWRRSLTDRVGPEADKYLARLRQLRKKYSIRMESVGRRLEERFGHPMQIDRLRALVAPAMCDPASKKCARTFELLQHEAQAFSRRTMGVGMDLPGWLAALEQEVEQYHLPERLKEGNYSSELIEPVFVPIEELKSQLEQLPRRHKQ